MIKVKSLLICGALISTLAHAETASNKVNQVIQSAQTKLYDLVDKDITTVNFSKGRAELSEAEVRNIRAVYKSVLEDTSVSRVIIASWSDHEGLRGDKKLPEAQVSLSQKRSDAVKRIIGQMSSKPVETYNMAQDSSWIGKTFRTDDAKLKEAVKSPGTADSAGAKSLADTLEAKGGPGKAVVIVQRNSVNSTTGR